MNLPRRALARLALSAICGAAAFLSANAVVGQASSKIVNFRMRPLQGSEAQFIEAALKAPARGGCEALSPDLGFVEEISAARGRSTAAPAPFSRPDKSRLWIRLRQPGIPVDAYTD